jgi:hypothetical protein
VAGMLSGTSLNGGDSERRSHSKIPVHQLIVLSSLVLIDCIFPEDSLDPEFTVPCLRLSYVLCIIRVLDIVCEVMH